MQSSRWWNTGRSVSLRDVIAFLGQGRMGVPMARRLSEAGHEVTTWRRGSGVTAAAAVDRADLVITMLRDPDAVREVLTAAAPGLRPGATVVEMSTIGPEAVRELRAALPSAVSLVDAPVLGSVGPAADGTLTVLAGGDLSGCREVLGVFGTVRELGPLGAGAAMKLAVMSALVPAQVLLAETFAYADAHGIDRDALAGVLSGTPLGILAGRLHAPAQDTRYALGLAAKDLGLAAWPGASLANAAHTRLREAEAAGLTDRDITAIAHHVRATPPRSRARPVNPATVPATNGFYSHAVRVGDMLYVSGQAAFDERGELVGEGSMTAQAEHVFGCLSRILADQGATFGDLAFLRTYLTDMDLRMEYGQVRKKYITGTPPASTTVEVSRLFMPGALLEVDAVVALPGTR
ncbi:NAD(P)-binding domain-containing protein [Nonomuraea sp. NPDC049714]|uniref:NAD(P)-binding domain-containing protein n=1 Tax=Nonomuraea sp. NPDC049714 TaxID=3364357 RepID=UPI0037877722